MQNRSIKDDIRDYWAGRAADYDRSPGHGLGSGPQRAAWDSLLIRHLGGAAGRQALDLGCSTGEITLRLHALGFRATGLDLTPEMLARARDKAAGDSIAFHLADAEALMEPDASQDVIVARYLLWTLPDPKAALRDWHRVLRPGGIVLLIDGDHATPPPLAGLSPWLDRWLGPDPKAAHGMLTADQWQAHGDILSRLPLRQGLRLPYLQALLAEVGFLPARAEVNPVALRPCGWRQRLLGLGRHRFALSARRGS